MDNLGQADRDALIAKLEVCRAVRVSETRAEVLEWLPADIASRVRREGPLRVVVSSLVMVCAEWPDGLQQLREAVRHFEGETFAMQGVDEVYASLGLPVVDAVDGESAPAGGEGAGEALDKLVEELVNRLAEQRKAGSPSAQTSELTGRIDWLVSTIKRRFVPREGATVAGARLVRVVGSGNFGTIWHAEDGDTGETVAVKIFRLERLSEGQMLSRFRRSIRAMRRLGEKKRLGKRDDTRGHIVRYRGEDASGLAFAMDYLSQGNLEHIDQQRWTQERKLEVMLSVCSAVHYAHQNGVIHRDIKPANIVLDDGREPVLTDFDIADIKWATSLSTTVEGGLGTPVFAAPEQLVDAELATEAADVYSLGRLLYYLLLERSPGYEVEKDPSLGNLSDQRPALVEIVRKATQYFPQRRYQRVKNMMEALEGCHTGAAAARARLSRVWRWVRHNRALLTIVALVVAGALGFAVYQAGVAKEQQVARERAERAETQLAETLEAITGLQKKVSDTVERPGGATMCVVRAGRTNLAKCLDTWGAC